MLEFELKYKLDKIPEFLKGIPSKPKTVEDVYYDTKNFKLLQNGNFLRLRNNSSIDFKLDIEGNERHICCDETNFNVKDIHYDNNSFVSTAENLSLESKPFNSFDNFIENNSMIKLAKISKERYEYVLDDVVISLDMVENLGLFLEAEMNFENLDNSDYEIVETKLIEKLKKCNLICDNDEIVDVGYVELYLLQFNKQAYEKGKFKVSIS